LLAIGEVSCTGVHGANRLASNSLLEGLVFGLHAADRLADSRLIPVAPPPAPAASAQSASPVDFATLRRQLQHTMSESVAVVRSRESLLEARNVIEAIAAELVIDVTIPALELRNMVLLAHEIITSALEREESRGAHYRRDFPETDPDLAGQHQIIDMSGNRAFRALHRELSSIESSR
jgi:L-aspartate oxidase